MSDDAQRALQTETEFLAGVESNFERAKGTQLRGSAWQTARHDEDAALREMLVTHRRSGWQALIRQMPLNRRIAVQGFERRWLFFRRPTGVAIASVLCPLEHLASGADGPMPPVDVGDLVEHVQKLTGDPKVQHVIGVCSPSGFTDEARNARLDQPNVTLVLIEPREGGGWRVTGADENLPEAVLAMFDPEAAAQKIARVRREIEARSGDLLVGGIGVESVAHKLELPVEIVQQAFAAVARSDPELRLTGKAGDALLYRGAAEHKQEAASMNVVDRIKAIFSREGDEAQKINILAERRAALAQRRDRIYEDIAKLEGHEAKLLEQGRSTTSKVTQRRLVSQLAQLRKDLARQNTTANMLNSQINIISTDIHNLTLIQQNQMAQLPDTEELTQNAVKAEEMLESLRADADLVSSLETDMGEVMTSDEELAILKEFEAAPEKAEQAKEAKPEAAPETMPEAAHEPPAPEASEKSSRPADAEPT